jgi:uncharacterized caspase-like protein
VPEGIVALFSCSAGQQSYEHPDLDHGVFFYHVLEGWKGAASFPGGVACALKTLVIGYLQIKWQRTNDVFFLLVATDA